MYATLFYFILALLLLITVHEFGHFIVARWCGVKVLRFSFGFGKVLAHWHDKKGTEYAWSLLPLGGYVKMLDESEGEVPAHERHLAFNNQSVWKRIAIVIAGPLFNFIFAFFALWLVLVIGIQSLAPIIDHVLPNSIVAEAGVGKNEEITSFNGTTIKTWRDFQYAIMPLIGSDETVSMQLKTATGGQKTVLLPLAKWHLDSAKPDPLLSLGLVPFVPKIPPIVGEVVNNAPAAKAGLQVGDVVETMNGKPLDDWMDLVEYVQAHPKTVLNLGILRDGNRLQIPVEIGTQQTDKQVSGYIGLRSKEVNWPKEWLRRDKQSPLKAIPIAFNQTLGLTGATFSLIGRLITGKLSMQSISGPVGIAQGAGASARNGLVYYLSFLALVSISLGVLNILPIPMLDGGHLLFFLIEVVRKKPVSDQTKTMGFYIGMLVLVALMLVALGNDIFRLTT